MKTHTITKVLLLSLLVGLSLVACRNNLSRSKAEELIVKAYNLPQPETLTLDKSYINDSRGDQSGPFGIGQVCLMIGGNKYSDKKEMLNELESKHLITIKESTTREGACTYLWKDAVLTDEGKKYLLSETEGQYVVRVCEIAFNEVTGIQTLGDNKVAVADFTLKRINITPFGKNISQRPFSAPQATFSLFDDGWRINKR